MPALQRNLSNSIFVSASTPWLTIPLTNSLAPALKSQILESTSRLERFPAKDPLDRVTTAPSNSNFHNISASCMNCALKLLSDLLTTSGKSKLTTTITLISQAGCRRTRNEKPVKGARSPTNTDNSCCCELHIFSFHCVHFRRTHLINVQCNLLH